MLKTILLLVTILCVVFCDRLRFDNYRAYLIEPKNEAEIQVIQEFEYPGDSIIFITVLNIDMIGRNISVVVAPDKQNEFTSALTKNRISYTLLDKNIQNDLDAELQRQLSCSTKKGYGWNCYHTLEETYEWFEKLCRKYPNKLVIVTGGTTFEGRDIRGIKLSYKSGNKAIVIEGGVIAREWMSPATITYILNELLTSTDPQVQDIAMNYDWYIFPIVNPDGYHYTHTTNRLWRKNRAKYGNCCYGVDLNRNWNNKWGQSGVSHNPCSITYPGLHPTSEIEVKTLSRYIQSIKNLRGYFLMHSLAQMILSPYGYTNKPPKNYADLVRMGNVAKNVLAQRYGKQYKIGTTYDILYPTSGIPTDWAYDKLGVQFNYLLEVISNTDNNIWNAGIRPNSMIIPTGKQALDIIVSLMYEGKKLGYFN